LFDIVINNILIISNNIKASDLWELLIVGPKPKSSIHCCRTSVIILAFIVTKFSSSP